MTLTAFQQEFKDTLLKITDDKEYIYGFYLQARTDEIRQQIIDGIKNGTIKTEDDILAITITMSPGYEYLKEQGIINENSNKS